MIFWSLQLADLLQNGTIHFFFIFGAFCWFVWIVRWIVSLQYKPFQSDKPRPAVSILIPTFNESNIFFEDCLHSVVDRLGPGDELIVLMDERDRNAPIGKLPFFHPQMRISIAPPGKRAALRLGFQQSRNPIVIVTASDTYFTDSTIPEICKPFDDEDIMGVSGRVTVSQTRGIGARCYAWANSMRNLMIYPALSTRGTVHVMNGECYAIRRYFALEYQFEFTNQTFLGRKCDSGDDGWMTTLILRNGYKAVYQSTAVTITEAPNSLEGFIDQQTRWNRNSFRRSTTVLFSGWSWRRGFMYMLQIFTALVRCPAWLVVLALAIYSLIFHSFVPTATTVYLEPWWSDWRILIFLGSIVLIRALRGLPYLIENPRAVLFLPLYAFIAPFILAPIKFYAMLTAWDTRWITRNPDKPVEETPKPKRNVPMAAIVLLLALLASVNLFVAVPVLAMDEECCY
ncbi:MAG: glycosyltransferase [Dehalococcoidales bacterium]|nr:glycosyltransferase [Dehalococcoidales bacterium]